MGNGQRIIDSLKEAAAGNFARVTVEGKTWVRIDDLNQPVAKIVDRLRANWAQNSAQAKALMRLINSIGSCDNVNLTGIERDLVVYAMASTLFAEERGTND